MGHAGRTADVSVEKTNSKSASLYLSLSLYTCLCASVCLKSNGCVCFVNQDRFSEVLFHVSSITNVKKQDKGRFSVYFRKKHYDFMAHSEGKSTLLYTIRGLTAVLLQSNKFFLVFFFQRFRMVGSVLCWRPEASQVPLPLNYMDKSPSRTHGAEPTPPSGVTTSGFTPTKTATSWALPPSLSPWMWPQSNLQENTRLPSSLHTRDSSTHLSVYLSTLISLCFSDYCGSLVKLLS